MNDQNLNKDLINPEERNNESNDNSDDLNNDNETNNLESNNDNETNNLESNNVNTTDNLESNNVNTTDNLESNNVNTTDNLESNNVNTTDNLESNNVNTTDNLESNNANTTDNLESNNVNTTDNLESNNVNSTDNLESNNVNTTSESILTSVFVDNQINSEETNTTDNSDESFFIEQLNFNFQKMIFSKHKYNVRELQKVLIKELRDDNISDFLTLINSDKVKEKYELLAVIYFYVLNQNRDVSLSEKIIESLDKDGILVLYFYTMIEGIRNNHKNIVFTMYQKLVKYSKKNYLTKIAKKIRKKKIVAFDVDKVSNDTFNDIKKIFFKAQKKEKVYTPEVLSILKYLFRYFEVKRPKLGHKIYKKIQYKFDDEARMDILLSLAKGYMKNEKYKKAMKIYQSVLSMDRDNFIALEGLTLCANKASSFNEVISKTKLSKVKGFDRLVSIANDSKDDINIKRIDEIKENEVAYREKQIDVKLKNIRKIINTIAIFLMICFVGFALLLDSNVLKILAIVCASIFALTGLINRDIKGSLVKIIVKAVVAIAFIVAIIIFVK